MRVCRTQIRHGGMRSFAYSLRCGDRQVAGLWCKLPWIANLYLLAGPAIRIPALRSR